MVISHNLSFFSIVSIICLFAAPLEAFSVLSSIDGFQIGSNTRLGASSDNEEVVPFFATMFAATDDNGSGGLKEGKASITNRLPLGKIFDSREYIFNTATNIRGYEWTTKEAEEMFDDLLDTAKGKFGMSDYELSQIVLIPMSWDRDALGLGSRYDVYDGQQRLVTLCMILGALRDSFINSETHSETATEIANMLNPTKVRKEDVLRIELNKRDNEVVSYILKGDMESLESFKKLQTKNKISNAQKLILQNYNTIAARVEALEEDDRLALLDCMIENVYMLVCLPESPVIARNLVMGQGKGKDNEIIDDFKGLVCFRYIQNENVMYKTFDEWDNLASTEDMDNGAVGRQIVSDACLLRTMASLRSKISKQNQLYEMEGWLRNEIAKTKGDKDSGIYEGDVFFKEHIKPASLALAQFRFEDDAAPTFGFTTKLKDSTITKLRFLHSLLKGVSGTREVEVIVLELLLRSRGSIGKRKMSMNDFESYLHVAEQFALYCAVAKPSTTKRYEKCFAFLDVIENDLLRSGSNDSFELLSEEEKSNLRERLIVTEFGSTAGGKRLLAALMNRLNNELIIQKNVSPPTGILYHVEPILPIKPTKKAWADNWPDKDERDKWVYKLGNYCLVSHKATTKESKASFIEKKARYGKEKAFPLTEQIASLNHWDKKELTTTFLNQVNLIADIWCGGSDGAEIELI